MGRHTYTCECCTRWPADEICEPRGVVVELEEKGIGPLALPGSVMDMGGSRKRRRVGFDFM